MRRIYVPCAALLLALMTSLAYGQSSVLTLDVALQTALRQNPTLRSATALVDASRGALDQAGAWPNPTLDVDQEDTRHETRSTTVLLNQPFELGGKRAARLALARSGNEIALADLAARQAEVRAGTIQAFFEALMAQEHVKVAEESLRIAERGSNAATRRVTAGKVSPTEETRARVAESQARIELIQARAQQQYARRALSWVMGVADSTLPPLEGQPEALPQSPSVETFASRISQSPALRRAQGEVERAHAAYALERAHRMPDVTVSLGSKRVAEMGRHVPMIGVSIPLPLFDSNRGAQLEALRKHEAAQALAEAEEQRLRSEVLQTLDQLQARRGEVQVLQQEVLPGAQSAYEAASRGFELGKFNFLDVLDAQRTWLQARTQYLSALAQAHRAAAELERRLGAPNANPNPIPGTQP